MTVEFMDHREKYPWLYDILFLLVLVLAGYLRLAGVNWGEAQHQHPDELFLSGVLGSLQAHKCADPNIAIEACPSDQQRWMGLADYLSTATSTLNPYNRGYAFFVYGNLPMTLIRVGAEIFSQTDFGALKLFGRQFSAVADLLTIFLLYLIASRLYGRRVGLLASLFSALTVMQIQQSHFLTTDLFTNLFMFLAITFAVEIVNRKTDGLSTPDPRFTNYLLRFVLHPLVLLSLGFGFALGMAMASKINAAALAILLPAAFAVRYFQRIADRSQATTNVQQSAGGSPLVTDYWTLVTVCLITGALATLVSFRVFQPYAFEGIGLNPQWVANIKEQRVQATGDADLPWNLQWAKRSHLYSFINLTVWGLGLPLGILAWLGFLWMGWRILKGEWRHALLWGWTAFYFLWQSMQFNPTMRYQLPVYPLLAMMAAWFVFEASRFQLRITQYALRTVGALVLALAVIWAFAFHGIYLRDEPRMAASRWIYQNIPGPINVQIQTVGSPIYNQPLPFPTGGVIQTGQPYDISFTAHRDGMITDIILGHAANPLAPSSTLNLLLSNVPNSTPEQSLAQASITADFASRADLRGDSYTLTFDNPVSVTGGAQYYLHFDISAGSLALNGAALANETDYDYGLPFRVDAYDGFGGIYRGDLNLQVYWDDNADKLTRFIDTLNQTDYIFIPTNHQYGQITRLPERYPLTTFYYRELIGCPPEKDIIWCYRVAQPGQFKGRLGFDLFTVFESYPTLGPLVINDQSAEEAFTFYDHPKVLVFKKSAAYNSTQVQALLGTVDLSRVVHLTPKQFKGYRDLLLPPNQLANQRAGGTWSELFNYNWIHNRYPALGLVIWYLFIFALGLLTYPLVRLALPGLADKGYPLSRALGLLVLGYLSWMAGSIGIPYTRPNIAVFLGLVFAAGAVLVYYQREELREEWKSKRYYFLLIEGIFLAFFLIDLLIRLGNPDMWHPAKGGERPMDFSYFNAILKSTSFPPYDPWFAGGYINYYYYGFVLVATPVKLLGIVPSIAYNFILPTLFAIVALCALSVGWNLLAKDEGPASKTSSFIIQPASFISGLAASLLTVFLGNLGTVQLIYQRLQSLAAPGGIIEGATILQRWIWAFQGIMQTLKGAALPIGPGDWYWFPSRVIPPGPGNEITEFPFFTFLYSDLHAHMIAFPIMLLALAWTLSVITSRARWRNQLSAGLGFVIGGLIIGALYPTNLSDIYTYLPIGLTALGYSLWRYADVSRWLPGVSSASKRIALIGIALTALTALSFYMYAPYRAWYSQAYSSLDPWKGPYTSLSSYLTHWSVFLFIITAWMAWETREWLAATPVSSLDKLRPYQLLIECTIVAFVLALLILAYLKVNVGWVALPLAVWAGVLLLRPNIPDAKRLVLFLVGTALLITIMVEVVVVRGDIGRANTIFKFYLQAWMLLAVSAAAAFTWTLPETFKWFSGWRNFWQTMVIVFLAGAALFTVTGTSGKVRDRWIVEAPHTLDAMTYMKYAYYDDFGQRMDLSEDYRAIRWMQDNIKGSPVIVEANCPEYRWCTRFTIYTGLPGVVGWNWHQRQQRALMPTQVTDRVDAITGFYTITDIEAARSFLKKYGVRYIIVGQLERAEYGTVGGAPGGMPEEALNGLIKFQQYDGTYWRSVYRDANTTVYEVIP